MAKHRQASTPIDLLQTEWDVQRQALASKKKVCGVLIILLAGAIWLPAQVLKMPAESKAEDPLAPVEEMKKPPYDLPPRKPEPLPRETLAHRWCDLPQRSDYVTTLANTPLPAKLKTTELVTLLDCLGMPTTIPADTLMTVNTRTAGGRLTITIAGKAYVDHEDRIAQKAKLVEPAKVSPPLTPR